MCVLQRVVSAEFHLLASTTIPNTERDEAEKTNINLKKNYSRVLFFPRLFFLASCEFALHCLLRFVLVTLAEGDVRTCRL